jgi:hypothetical protein
MAIVGGWVGDNEANATASRIGNDLARISFASRRPRSTGPAADTAAETYPGIRENATRRRASLAGRDLP